MNARIRKGLLAAALAAVATGASAGARPGDAVDAFHAALKAGKRDAALAVLAPEARIFEQGFVEQSAKEYSGEHLAADMEFSASVPRKVTHREFGEMGDVAWVLSEATATGKFKETPVDLVQTETVLLRRQGERWQIMHIHWSAHSAAKEPEKAPEKGKE